MTALMVLGRMKHIAKAINFFITTLEDKNK